jgi:soluble lytic murein transglycosylase-like protein
VKLSLRFATHFHQTLFEGFPVRVFAPVFLLLALVTTSVHAAPLASPEKLAVAVPVKLDYPLLRKLLEKQVFTGPDSSREVLRDQTRCNQAVLSEPQIGPRLNNLEIHARVAARLGFSFFGTCFHLFDWNGSMGFLGLPVIKPGGTALGLEPQGIWLTKANGERITSGRMWNYVQAPLQDVFASFTVDLAPFSATLGSLLPDVLPNRSAEQLQETLDSLKLGSLKLSNSGLDATIRFTVDRVAVAEPYQEPLSAQELEQWQTRWQMMDALMVFAVKHYAAATQLEDLRSALLDILIDSRYQLVEALEQPADRSNDVVRVWFLDSWQKLTPVVRKIALQQEGKESLVWISVLAATDALYAMDQLGPQLGLDISTDGLRRLARMINNGVEPQELRYDDAVDPELQELFHQQIELRAAQPSAWNISFSLMPLAYADSPAQRLDHWVPAVDEIEEYLPLVAELLDESSQHVARKYKLESGYRHLFQKLVLATAWQESCWRQYIVNEDGKIAPLLSSSGDVGLMQMNERVWRGFYDLQKLRWDITYNSNAGAEVLLDYLIKYAIKRGEQRQPGGIDNLARATYSAYNGGPGKASRYRRSDASSYSKKVDTAFWKKYQRINQDHQSGIARCLGAVT